MNGHHAVSKNAHLLVIHGNFRSHIRFFVTCLPGLLQFAPNLTVTFAFHRSSLKEVNGFVDECKPSAEIRSRLELLPLCGAQTKEQTLFAGYDEIVDSVINEHWDELFDGTGSRPTPNGLVVDYFAERILTHAKMVKPNIPRFMHNPCLPGSLVQCMQQRSGKYEIVSSPGHPSLFVHEMIPCSAPWPQDLAAGAEAAANRHIFEAEQHVVTTFSRNVIPHTLDGFADMLEPQGKKVIDIQAPYPESFWQRRDVTGAPDEVGKFLDAKLKSHGEKSVLWISFGTLFFPGATRPDLIDALVDVLIERGRPFVFLLAAFAIELTPDHGSTLQRRCLESGNMAVKWTNQQLHLQHPALSTFLTHGGTGSVYEALVYELPLIIWPVAADQAPTAEVLDLTLDCAWQLFQGRDMLVGKKLMNHPDIEILATPEAVRAEFETILDQLDGPVGKRKRANAKKRSRILREEHEKQEEVFREFLSMFA